MTQEEIIKKAIMKGIANGYKWKYDWVEKYELTYTSYRKAWNVFLLGRKDFWGLSLNDIIFDHRFAKAFWGEEKYEYEIEVGPEGGMVYDVARLPAWQYHLQQLILEEDPIAYLGRFIKEEL